MKPILVRAVLALSVSLTTLAAVALIDGPTGQGQEPKEAAAVPTGPYSALHCIGCHGGTDTKAYEAYDKDKSNPARSSKFVQLSEYATWHDHDLHAQAYVNIVPKDDNLAAKMQMVLAGTTGRDKDYRVEKAAECLTCHSVDRGDKLPADTRFHKPNGVSCEACHGFAEKWFAPHVQPEWRAVTPDVKHGTYGLVDLRNPAVRAEKCASCHVGDKAAGKFVTHEMYAAGHPPLPPFELATFSRDQPRHYDTHRQMAGVEKRGAALLDPAGQARFHYFDPATHCPEARDLALGSLASFEASMALLAKDAETTMGLLDFAHFDCYACHHALKIDDEGRKQPRDGLKPGQPPMRSWGVDPLRAVLKHAESAAGPNPGEMAAATAKFDDLLTALTKAFNERPFGNAKTVAEAAGKLQEACVQIRKPLALVRYTPEETLRLYRLMADHWPKVVTKDHDTAQQYAWSLAVLQQELRLSSTNPGKDDPAAMKNLNAFVAMKLTHQPDEDAIKRGKARQKMIDNFEAKPFTAALDDWLKAFAK